MSKGNSTITTNRRARYDYDIVDTVEAGLVLTGAEIKSVRGRKVSLSDSYARPANGEMWLHNLHIDEYAPRPQEQPRSQEAEKAAAPPRRDTSTHPPG